MADAGRSEARQESPLVNELSSAETALNAVGPVLAAAVGENLRLPTPCPGFDVAELADHLVGTVTMVGDAAGAHVFVSPNLDVEARISQAATSVIEAWRRRGTSGDAVFAGRVMPAHLALGVLSVELVVHGWDFAQALARPLPITAAHADFVLSLAHRIITPDSRRTAGFEQPVAITTDAEAMDRLVAFTGRHPQR
ncbi:TIGR03086 family protein [Mycolicibacterium llatzerense]|nr:TIGR03086 family protein [Mycolicibacterium llatzerense]